MDYKVRLNYWAFVEREAKKIKSDGCTGVNEWHRECCYEHDLACHYGKTPRSAYGWYCNDPLSAYWTFADPMSRRQADYLFKNCNLEWSTHQPIGKIRSIARFLGVWIGAFFGIGCREPKETHGSQR